MTKVKKIIKDLTIDIRVTYNIRKEAHLEGADFRFDNLEKVDLEGAFLGSANFFEANLRGANLRGAKVMGTDFSDSDLCGADLRGIEYDEETRFDNVKTDGMIIDDGYGNEYVLGRLKK